MSRELLPFLEAPLEELNRWLVSRGTHLELTLIGAAALTLRGYRRPAGFESRDMDSVTDLEASDIFEVVAEIGRVHRLGEDWLNDNSRTLPLPLGCEDRLSLVQLFSNITAWVVARGDLISLKCSAFISRGAETRRDLEDLRRMSPTPEEIQTCIVFAEQTNRPDPYKDPWKKDFEDSVAELRNAFKN